MKKNKCNVVLITTQNKINSLKGYNDKSLLFNFKESYNNTLPAAERHCSNFHLYITSTNEIKEGDWCIDFRLDKTQNLIKWNKDDYEEGWFFDAKKIIASTDPELHKDGVAKIGLPFIEKYITEYNKGNVIKEVNVEYEILKCAYTKNLDGSSQCSESPNCMDWAFGDIKQPENTDCNYRPKLRLRSDGTIIIHKVQEVFTKEDMKKAFFNGSWSEKPSNEFETWFEQNY